LLFEQSFGKPCGQLKVFRLIRENIFGELDDQGVVGDFPVTLAMPGGGWSSSRRASLILS